MPSTITHTIISLDVFDKLNKKPQSIIKRHIEDYKSFAQGMDILYFYHFLLIKGNEVQKLGHSFHNYKTNEIFKDIINECKETKKEIIFTFLAGLVTHYSADSIMHPYINFLAQSDIRVKHHDIHFETETFLDNYMLEKKGKLSKKYKSYKLQFNNKKNNDIVRLINEIYFKYFNYRNMGKKYYKALKDMRFVFKYGRYDRTGIKRKIYKLIDKNKFNVRRITYVSYNFPLKNEEKYLNNNHRLWYNVNNKNITSNKSFEELYEDVINVAYNIINTLYLYIYEDKEVDIDKLLGNRSYGTGLILK